MTHATAAGARADPSAAPRVRATISDRPLAPDSFLDSLGSSADGAVLLFLGRVREENEGRRVVELEYEAYREMAEAELLRIAREAAAEHRVGEIAVAHRVGTLDVGEVSVAIAVAAPHRADGYAASRAVIEEIKKRLPVWKRERYADGTEAWVGAEAYRQEGGAATDGRAASTDGRAASAGEAGASPAEGGASPAEGGVSRDEGKGL